MRLHQKRQRHRRREGKSLPLHRRQLRRRRQRRKQRPSRRHERLRLRPCQLGRRLLRLRPVRRRRFHRARWLPLQAAGPRFPRRKPQLRLQSQPRRAGRQFLSRARRMRLPQRPLHRSAQLPYPRTPSRDRQAAGQFRYRAHPLQQGGLRPLRRCRMERLAWASGGTRS